MHTESEKPIPELKKEFRFGTEVRLDGAPLFRTSTYPTSHRALTGRFFLYDGVSENERYKVVASKSAVRYKPEEMVFIGWVDKKNLTKVK